MKKIQFAMSLILVSTLSLAASLKPVTNVAPTLVDLSVVKIASKGMILSAKHQHPYSQFKIGIPVEVQTGSACTQFVGQQLRSKGALSAPTLVPVGATNPLVDACIAIAVLPVKTVLTVDMNILTGGFVPANPIQRKLVAVNGAGVYNVVLDMNREEVKIELAPTVHPLQ